MKKGKKYSGLPISDLPSYIPRDSVWKAVSTHLDAETENKEENQDGRIHLPDHEPPQAVWKEIESSLNLQDQIVELPGYVPPDLIWNEIENTLSGNKISGNKKYIPLLKWAATILLITGFAVVISLLQPQSSELEYSVEWEHVDESIEVSQGLSGYDMIVNLCARSKELCDTPEFIRWENELEELEKAREQVKSQMSPYSDNKDLERLLMRIEMEHAEIMKQMASSLL